MVSSFLAVLIFVRFADEFGASGNIETKEQGKKKHKCYNHVIYNTCGIKSPLCSYGTNEIKSPLCSSSPFQVWYLCALKKMKTGIYV